MMSAAKNLFQAVRRSFTNNSNNNNNDDNNNNNNSNNNSNSNNNGEEEEEEHPYLSLYGMILPTQPQPQTQTLYSEITTPVITTVTTMAITPITNPSGNNNLPSAPQQQQQQQQQKIKAASNSSNSINRNENVKIDKEWISIRSEIRASVSRASKNRNKRNSGNNNYNDDSNDDDDGDDDDDDDDDNDDNVQGRKTQPKGYIKNRSGNYEAQIKFKGKSRNIGTFKYARDAALAYEIAKRRVQVPPILQRSDKEWKLIRSEVKAIIENENTVDNCIDDNSDDYADDDDNNEGVLGRRQPKGYRKTPSGTFEAMLRFKGKKRNIGTFKDERDAALAFKVAKRKVEALQQQLLPSSSSSSNNNNNNNNNRSREMRSFNPTLTMILNNNSNNNHNIAKTNYKENGSSPTTTTTSGSSSNLSSGGNAVVNHKKRKSTIDDDKDCDYDKDCDCDKHRASISSTTLLEDGIDTDGPDGQSSKRTLICREIAREVVGQSPYERRILDMIKNGVDPTTASHLSLYGMILPPQTQTKTQTQTQTLYGESIATMATLITDPSGNNSHPSSWVDNDPGANADDDGDASDVEDYHDALMEIDSNDNNSNKGEEKDDAST